MCTILYYNTGATGKAYFLLYKAIPQNVCLTQVHLSSVLLRIIRQSILNYINDIIVQYNDINDIISRIDYMWCQILDCSNNSLAKIMTH